MKNLLELHAQSKAALPHGDLVETAANNNPDNAFKEGRKNGWDDLRSESCKALATIKQEYGLQAFQATVEDFYTQELRDYLNQKISPRIELAEKIVQAPLLIRNPDLQGQPLRQWLQSLPQDMDLELGLGGFTLGIRNQVYGRGSDGGKGYGYCFKGNFWLKNPEGVALDNHSWEWYSGYRFKETEVYFFKRRFLQELKKILGARAQYLAYGNKNDWHYPLIQWLTEYYGQRGWAEKLPPHLDQDKAIITSVKRGEVEQAQSLIAQLRKRLEQEGKIKPQFLSFVDFERHLLLVQARRWRRYHDKTIPLIDKVLDDTVKGNFWPVAISGPKATKSYTFFLMHDVDDSIYVDAWLRVLTKLGYGGSILISCYNRPSQLDIVGTGQVNALFEDDWGSWGGGIRTLQNKLKAAGFPQAPEFCRQLIPTGFGMTPTAEQFVEEFTKFLQLNFPLQ